MALAKKVGSGIPVLVSNVAEVFMQNVISEQCYK